MRTTLSIDDDVSRLLEQEARRSGESFKGTVNRLLRLGLTASRQRKVREPFVVTPMPMSLPAGMNYDKVEQLLETLDGPGHK